VGAANQLTANKLGIGFLWTCKRIYCWLLLLLLLLQQAQGLCSSVANNSLFPSS
jgi:hypothetical protein